MPNIFDQVEESVHELAAIISLTLGIALLVSGSWALHETLDSESRLYFIIGYMSGTKHYPAKELLTELNQKLSPYVTLLKANFSIVILIGLIQISGAIIGFKVGKLHQVKIGWLISLGISTIFSLVSCIVPISIGLHGILELQIVVTISGVNAFILLHIIGVLAFKLREEISHQNVSSSASVSPENTTASTSTTTSIALENPILPGASPSAS